MSELHRWASAALSWIDEIYPADIFDGSSGDEGPVRIVEIRENLRQALTMTAAQQAQANETWTPLEQGRYEDVSIGSKYLAIRLPKEIIGNQVTVFLPDDMRLCRRAKGFPADGMPLTDEIRETIAGALYNFAGVLPYRHAALAWLQQQPRDAADAPVELGE